jgi:hypothetical protein
MRFILSADVPGLKAPCQGAGRRRKKGRQMGKLIPSLSACNDYDNEKGRRNPLRASA